LAFIECNNRMKARPLRWTSGKLLKVELTGSLRPGALDFRHAGETRIDKIATRSVR
jgi:hypothetical protein